MARILVTSARATVSLELIRNLGHNGHYIIAADSMDYPLSFKSKYVAIKKKIASPVFNPDRFKEDIIQIINSYNIELIIPTCEEIFYLAKLKPIIEQRCSLFCPEFKFINKLHNKYEILKLVKDLDISIPETKLLTLEALKSIDTDLNTIVIKPEFGRFGSLVLIKPNIKQFNSYIKRQENNLNRNKFLVQKFIPGKEVCSYSIIHNGEVMVTSCYHPKYKVSRTGIYFEKTTNLIIEIFIKDFARKYNFTGQISFDYIISSKGIFVIECNPRTVSGVHLLESYDLFSLFSGKKAIKKENPIKPKMVKSAMILFALKDSIKKGHLKEWIIDLKRADDIIRDRNDINNSIYQIKSYFELIRISKRENISINESATWDIGFNGVKKD